MKEYDVVIIGGGPAALSAALYLARGGKSAAILEKSVIGGKLAITAKIENYPGAASSDGYTLAEQMKKNAVSAGAQIVECDVSALDADALTVTADGETYKGRAVIIATGSANGKLGLERERELIGRGLSYCAVCDGAFFKGKEVALFGGGEHSLSDLKYLTGICGKVHYITPLAFDGDAFGAVVEDKAEITELIGDPLCAVKIKRGGRESRIDLSALFVDAAPTGGSAFLFGGLNVDEKGFLLTDEQMRTNKPLVYAAGDVRSKTLRQVVTAASDGAIAASSAIKDLSRKKI